MGKPCSWSVFYEWQVDGARTRPPGAELLFGQFPLVSAAVMNEGLVEAARGGGGCTVEMEGGGCV